jgi:uncharacterized membrane protein YgdD (TMEM256/DUF423 family)
MNGWLKLGALLAALAVTAGAVAAHGIEGYLEESYAGQTREMLGRSIPAAEKYLADLKTAAQYQMYHALGLLVVGLLAERRPGKLLTLAGTCFVLGIVLFCGSLYGLAVFAHGMEEPVRHGIGLTAASGGILFIVGWLCLASAVCACHAGPQGTCRPAP